IRAESTAAPPPRLLTTVTRIVRDSQETRALKVLYNDKCQLCGGSIRGPRDLSYSEVHHIRPLGIGHDGPDVAANMLVVCPNHHAMLDLGYASFEGKDCVAADGTRFTLTCLHEIDPAYVEWHNRHSLPRQSNVSDEAS